jgi:uncharacterized protein
MTDPARDQRIQAIERPDVALMKYYVLMCLVFPPLFPILIVPAYFRYHTMRYKFSDDGISMSWGILFRRQTILNYARIQDIHLRSNIVERWLGLARILIQTASGNQSAELTIEGIKEFEQLRDFLYARMRGVKDGRTIGEGPGATDTASTVRTAGTAGPLADELTAVLREAVRELRAVREAVEKREEREENVQPKEEEARHV